MVPRRNQTLIAVVAIIAVLTCMPARAADPRGVPFSMTKGDVFILEVETTRQDLQSSGRHEGGTIERERIEVLEKTRSGYVVDWSVRTLERRSNQEERLAPLRAIDDAIAGEHIKLDLDHSGRPVRAHGWREMLERVEAKARAKFWNGATDRQRFAFNAVFAALKAMDDAIAPSKLAETVFVWSAWHGETLERVEPYETSLQEPNPYPGRPVPMTRSVSPQVVDDQLTVLVNDRLGPGGDDALLDSFFGISPKLQAQRAQIEATYDVAPDLRYTRQFDIDLATGWTSRVDQTRVLDYGELSKSIMRRVITLVREPGF